MLFEIKNSNWAIADGHLVVGEATIYAPQGTSFQALPEMGSSFFCLESEGNNKEVKEPSFQTIKLLKTAYLGYGDAGIEMQPGIYNATIKTSGNDISPDEGWRVEEAWIYSGGFQVKIANQLYWNEDETIANHIQTNRFFEILGNPEHNTAWFIVGEKSGHGDGVVEGYWNAEKGALVWNPAKATPFSSRAEAIQAATAAKKVESNLGLKEMIL